MNPSSNDSLVSPYALSSIFTSRYHQHLKHLNDLAFNHTKLLQEMMEKRTFDSIDQRKRSYPDIESIKFDSQTNKRSRKQSNPQQVLRSDQDAAKDENHIDSPLHPTTAAAAAAALPPPLPSTSIPPISLEKIFETFQKDFLAASSFGIKRFFPSSPSLLPMFPPSMPHPMPPFPTFTRLIHPNHQHGFPPPFHFATAKKRRTKVTDTRISPRVPSKFPHSLPSNTNDLSDDDDVESLSDQSSEHNSKSIDFHNFQITSVLTSVHLRKAKLMFFYTRYPSSSVLKAFFVDVRFNKLITAQLVKWFSNFREFFYSQIEKYARQYLAEGVRHAEDLIITPHSDLYRVLNLHYNRSNQIEVPPSFSQAVQMTLREFFIAIQQQKDVESSWKKSIYKIIQRLDDDIPEFFKHDHWMHGI